MYIQCAHNKVYVAIGFKILTWLSIKVNATNSASWVSGFLMGRVPPR